MKFYRGTIPFRLIELGLACILVFSCRSNRVETGMLILTEAPGKINSQDFYSGVSTGYFRGARISAIIPDQTSSQKILTNDFYSACSPDISYDGRSMLFAAQEKQDEVWQIWEMNLGNLKCRKITSSEENCTDPAYLPGGRMVFSKLTVNDTVKTAHCLFTCNLDGSGLRQITFSPADNLATTVLNDGRLLTVNRQLLPVKRDPLLMVMRPDGTKADMFYRSNEGKLLISSAYETPDGKLVFIESGIDNNSESDLVSVTYNRPLHTRTVLTSGIDGDFCSVMPVSKDKYYVSCRKSDSETFALYEFDPENKMVGQMIFSDPGYSIIDAFLVEEYERPKKLPSEVDMEVKTGLLLCQDINFLDTGLKSDYSGSRKALKIEVLGVDTTYGVVQAEEDGSFQLKVMADTPFSIRTLDEKGNIVNGPCSWLWLRPNERRGCVGCHEDPEMVPENIVSLAIKKSPVIIPVHITDVKEKIVELE